MTTALDTPLTQPARRPGPVPHPASGSPRRRRRTDLLDGLARKRDLLVASDPGMNRCFAAVETGLAISVGLGVIYLLMQWTHLMWISVPAGAKLGATQLALIAEQHHAMTLVAMLLGGIMGMMSAFGVMEPRPRDQAITLFFMPIPTIAAMALAIWLSPHHALGVAVMALVLGIGTWGRRFIPVIGPRAVIYGAQLFVGYLIGFLSGAELHENQLGDLYLVLIIGCGLGFLIKLAFANPLARGRLNRTAGAFRARCRSVMAATVALLDADAPEQTERARRRLHRSLNRLNETALIIDASLAEIGPGRSANAVHDELFDLELLVQNIARISERLADAELPADLRSEIRTWMDDLSHGHVERAAMIATAFARAADEDADMSGDGARPVRQLASTLDQVLFDGVDPDNVDRVHRLVMTIEQAVDAVRDFPSPQACDDAEIDDEAFTSPVTLMFGDLPGSALVAMGVAGANAGTELPFWRRLTPPTQMAVRVTIAIGVAGGIGSIIDTRRFYWAVIAVFISFMGTNTSGEQVTKAAHRVLGTVVGIFIGGLFAHLIGHSTWSILVVILAMSVGIYFMKVSYGIFVIGITITVSQLYVQLGEYTNDLLLLRLGETTMGAIVAALCALLIFPVPTRRVIRAAAIGYLDALGDLLSGAETRLGRGGEPTRLTTSVRALDYAAQQFVAAAKPLRATPFRPEQLEHNVALVAQTAHQARNIASELENHSDFAPLPDDWLAALLYTERAAVASLTDALSDRSKSTVVHRVDDTEIAALDGALADAQVPSGAYQRRLLFQLDRLDETLAELHENVTQLAA